MDTLRAALARPDHPPVKLLDGPSGYKVPAAYAARLVSSGTYTWGGTLNRVRWIRSIVIYSPWQSCYRTTDAAVLPPSIEWLQRLYPIFTPETE
jgi:hypothetical protein